MAPKLSLEARMTIIELLRRGWSRVAIAKSLGVTEGSVRYHDRRRQEGKSDGRVGRQQHRLAALSTEVEAWLSAEASRRERLNLGALHEYLVVEHGYTGSLRSVQRYFRLTMRRRAYELGGGWRHRQAPRARRTGLSFRRSW